MNILSFIFYGCACVYLFSVLINGRLINKQNAEYQFRPNSGQYSALDMAQYVFWTGDEEGVANAVEEFIRKGLVCGFLF